MLVYKITWYGDILKSKKILEILDKANNKVRVCQADLVEEILSRTYKN